MTDFDEFEPPPEDPDHDPYEDNPVGALDGPPTVGEILAGVPWATLPSDAAEAAERARLHAAARRVHTADFAVAGASDRPKFRRLGDEFDPRGRHVGCDGEPDGTGAMRGGCGRPPGQACEHPRRGFVPGFVHPTRLAAERALWGLD